MKLFRPINNLFILVALTALFSCQNSTPKEEVDSRVSELPYYNSPEFTPNWISPKNDSLKKFHKIRDFNLVNQNGETITEQTVQGKIYIADFFFVTCPGICPKMTKNMGIVQEVFLNNDDVLILSHSVTPDLDSVSVLKSYAENHNIESGKWHLLTGKRNMIYDLGRNNYFIEEDLGLETENFDDEFIHTENFVLIDQNRHIRGIYNGLNKTSVQQLIADVKTLQENLGN